MLALLRVTYVASKQESFSSTLGLDNTASEKVNSDDNLLAAVWLI